MYEQFGELPMSDVIPKAVFPKGRFPEKVGLYYDNSAQSFRENVHSGKWLSGKRTATHNQISLLNSLFIKMFCSFILIYWKARKNFFFLHTKSLSRLGKRKPLKSVAVSYIIIWAGGLLFKSRYGSCDLLCPWLDFNSKRPI